jgi:hypothetical protein
MWLQFGFFLRCNDGWVEKHCEYSTDEVDSEEMDAYCRKENSSEIYSKDRMYVCVQCVYRKSDNTTEISSGKFWECYNFNCDKSNFLICGGEKIIRNGHRIWFLLVCCNILRVVIKSAVKGQHLGPVHPLLNLFSFLLLVFTFKSMMWLYFFIIFLEMMFLFAGNVVCRCYVCECYPNYTGSASDCCLDTTPCMVSIGQICNNQGTCECGVRKYTKRSFKCLWDMSDLPWCLCWT